MPRATWEQLLSCFNYTLLRNILGLIDIEAIKIDELSGIVVLVDVVKDSPGDVPLDTDLHFLVLLLAYSLLGS